MPSIRPPIPREPGAPAVTMHPLLAAQTALDRGCQLRPRRGVAIALGQAGAERLTE